MRQTGLTEDLNKSEEVVFVTIALNPDLKGEEIVDKLDTSEEVFSHCVNTLLDKGYIELLEEDEDNFWRVSELGQILLNKLRTLIKFDLIIASKQDEKDSIVKRLRKKKKRFEAAYSAAKRRRRGTR